MGDGSSLVHLGDPPRTDGGDNDDCFGPTNSHANPEVSWIPSSLAGVSPTSMEADTADFKPPSSPVVKLEDPEGETR